MQRFAHHLTAVTLLFTSGQAAADLIYSGLQDISIPTTYAGVNIDVNGDSVWDLNPFLGGVYLYNNSVFQPARDGTGGLDTVLNFTAGSIISSSLNYGTGTGGSMDHLGGQFTAGAEGYIGFKNGSNYGWMRVIFTNNNSGALIKEWAYDNSGVSGTIAVANITQTGSVVTADSTYGNFTVASVVADVGGATSFVKTGTGTTNLKATNTYTGATTVSDGRLNVNGSTHADSAFTVAAGKTLGGNGTINGNVTLNGILRPGQGGVGADRTLNVGGLTASSGSSIVFNIAAENNHDQLIVVGTVDLTNTNLTIESFTDSTVTELGAGAGANFFTTPTGSFYKLIDGTTTNMFANVTETMSAGELSYFGLSGTQYRYTEAGQTFWVAQGAATYLVAIPEPSIGLMGGLSLLGLALRRRR